MLVHGFFAGFVLVFYFLFSFFQFRDHSKKKIFSNFTNFFEFMNIFNFIIIFLKPITFLNLNIFENLRTFFELEDSFWIREQFLKLANIFRIHKHLLNPWIYFKTQEHFWILQKNWICKQFLNPSIFLNFMNNFSTLRTFFQICEHFLKILEHFLKYVNIFPKF